VPASVFRLLLTGFLALSELLNDLFVGAAPNTPYPAISTEKLGRHRRDFIFLT